MRIELAKAPPRAGRSPRLADGAQPWSIRVTLRAADRDTHVTIEDGQAVAFGLPCLIAPDGSGRVDHGRVERICSSTERIGSSGTSSRPSSRTAPAEWGQHVTSLRQKLGLEIAKRYG